MYFRAKAITTKVEWQDIAPGCSIAEFATKNNLDNEALSLFQGVMVLPNNVTLSEMPKQHLFSAHAKEVLFVLRESGVDARLYQDSRERRELVLKSTTVVLPTLSFIGSMASGVALGILSNWIYDRFVKNRQSEPTAIIRYEQADSKADGSVRWRRVEGPASQVSKLLFQESKRLGGEIAPEPPSATGANTRSLAKWDTAQKTKRKKASRTRKN